MVNICMNVYTQLNEPSLDATSKWFPCLITEPTQDQLVAKDQPILVTHIDCIRHYTIRANSTLYWINNI